MHHLDNLIVNVALLTGCIAVGGIVGKIVCLFLNY